VGEPTTLCAVASAAESAAKRPVQGNMNANLVVVFKNRSPLKSGATCGAHTGECTHRRWRLFLSSWTSMV
jgi:hypothetical protein